MRAAVCSNYGPPEVVKVEDLPSPALGPGQVRLKVHAAAVNFPDVLIVANEYQIKVPVPFVPGSELAGEVVEVGKDVTGYAPNDRVSATTLVGAFAEEAVVGASVLTPLPDNVDYRNAAAFGVAHRTAYHVLRSVADLRADEELVVLGAGGGVGLATVQLGALLGGRVTAVASSEEKLAAARASGAIRAVDYRAQDLRRSLRELLPEGSDVVVDPVGGALSEPALRSLRWGGRFITVGYATGEIPKIPLNLVLLKGIRILGFEFLGFASHSSEEACRNEEELMALLASGQVLPHIGASFSLEDTTAALRYVADGRAVGKVVIDVE